jgi:ArsR family transcriptional regulator
MKSFEAVAALGAMAHAHRLAVFRLLVQRGPDGLPAGAIAERIGLVPSSLTFHVQALQRAGLVSQRRKSRQIFYFADYNAVEKLVSFLTANCCRESVGSCAVNCKPASAPVKPGTVRRAA